MSNLPSFRPQQPRSPAGMRSHSSLSQTSMLSDESAPSTVSNTSQQSSSQIAAQSANQRAHYFHQQSIPTIRPSTSGGLAPGQPPNNAMKAPSIRNVSPGLQVQMGHRPRQHSQGFFEPSLSSNNPAALSASRIAAQAAMHHISPQPNPSQERKRSYPGLTPIDTSTGPILNRRPSNLGSPQVQSAGGLPYSNGTVGGQRLAATTAANVVFPTSRSPLPSPGFPPPSVHNVPISPVPKDEPKSKGSKMKLFKPKAMILSKEKEGKIPLGMPSPAKTPVFLRSGFPNASTTGLADPMSAAQSVYSNANASTSTLVPINTEKDKEKKLHFLSRQKHKTRDEATAPLPLSSAHSNSQATNPDRPQPLYSFTPDSPGHGSSFAKSMSGFDLRHAGRKKKEEKAAKLDLTPVPTNTSTGGASDLFSGSSTYDSNTLGPPTSSTVASVWSLPSETMLPVSAQAFSNIGAQMGLPGIGPDDAWPLLKARLLNLFSGETLRTPIEDFNALVNVHIRRCIQRRSPIVLIEDVRELLQTGFSSLAQTLRTVSDDRLVTSLVEMWIGVYGATLPFLQAVFLPLELEFRGRGSIMSAREAQEFWGAIPEALKSDELPTFAGGLMTAKSTLADELEIRRITLIAFRDTVIIPRHESLMAIFSRLSLDSLNSSQPQPPPNPHSRPHARSLDPSDRPSTAGSLSPRLASFNSQGSTLLDAGSSTTSSAGALHISGRSRATSSTSAGSFGTSLPRMSSPFSATGGGPGSFSATSPQPGRTSPALIGAGSGPVDPARVTEVVGRMLQCLYVLASCQTGDVAQGHVERLTGALKYNWLGRGRTGRDRRGIVGIKGGVAGRVGLVGA